MRVFRQIGRFYAAARVRARRRQSPWNLVLIPLGFAAWLGLSYSVIHMIWIFQVSLFSSHHFRDFWPGGIGFSAFVPGFVILFPPTLGALGLGLLIASSVAWLIPPARRVFDVEPAEYAGTSFGESNLALLNISLWTSPLSILLAMFAASRLVSLR